MNNIRFLIKRQFIGLTSADWYRCNWYPSSHQLLCHLCFFCSCVHNFSSWTHFFPVDFRGNTVKSAAFWCATNTIKLINSITPNRRSHSLLSPCLPSLPSFKAALGEKYRFDKAACSRSTSMQRKYISPRTERSLILPLWKDYKAGGDGEWHNLPRYPLRISKRLFLHQRPWATMTRLPNCSIHNVCSCTCLPPCV